MVRKKKTVVITGVNEDIGYETARQLLTVGYFVCAGSRNRAKGDAAVALLEVSGFADVEAPEIDVPRADSVRKAKEALTKEVNCLDVLINNAGMSGIGAINASQSSG